MSAPFRILFVCHGNICRSPMAEFIMKDLVHRAGRDGEFDIASAATSTEEIGNPVYPPAQRLLLRHGLDASGKRARQLTPQDYDRYDLLLGMEAYNIRNMMRILGGDPQGKVGLLLDRDIADPWFTGDFEATWRDLQAGCQALLQRLTP